jgi:hypothetical protein
MVVIHGRSYRGFVGGHAGQCSATQFLTVMFLPVAPLKGMWLVNSVTGAGHDMKLSGKSVAAAYVRAWGPLVAGVTAVMGTAGAVVASAVLGLTAWTWSWRFVLDNHGKKQLAMNQLALGTGCEPAMMSSAYANEVRASVDDNWRSRGNGGSPGDVARFGSDDDSCAAAAYGVLRMSALALPAGERAEVEAEAARILDNVREVPTGAHPYRGPRFAPRALPAAPRSTPAPLPSAPEPDDDSPVVPLATARLSALLRDTLVGSGFVPIDFDATVFDVVIEQVLVRRRFGASHVVVHLRAPKGAVAIHAGAFARREQLGDLVGLSRELLPSIGVRIRHSSWSPLSAHFVWSGGGVLARAHEIHTALVASDPRLNLQSIAVADLTAHLASMSRTKMRAITTRFVDIIARCVDQAVQ